MKDIEMGDSQDLPIKKVFLYSLIVSVLLSAIMGILAMLSGDWGRFEIRILLTTVTISGASICGLACGAYLATKRGQALPMSGMSLALLGAVLLIAGMWIDVKAEGYWKSSASVSVFAVACSHLALLSMASLAARFLWSLKAAWVVIFGLAALTVAMIWSDFQDEEMFRLLGVAAIVDAAVTILIPIFHWLSKTDVSVEIEIEGAASRDVIDAEIASLRKRIAELEQRRLEEFPLDD